MTDHRPTSATTEESVDEAVVDFDLHGLASVRLLDARPDDVTVVARQLGPLPQGIDGEPDITIRFVDAIQTRSPMRLLGAREAGWTDGDFYVLRSRKAPAVVRIPMDRIGGRCEIVCERGLPAVPFLIAVLNLTVLCNGALPVHAAAFELDGVGTLVTGWSKGGKTELLMAAARAGARYIGDEWVYVTTDGRMHGIPQPIRLWDWHLDQLPGARDHLSKTDRLKLRAIPALRGLDQATPRRIRRLPPNKLLHRAIPTLEGQLHADLPPDRLFGTLGDMSGQLDRILFVVSSADDVTSVEPIDPLEVAARMSASLLYERRDLVSLMLHAQFADPGLRNDHLEGSEARQRELLDRIFAGHPAYQVTHPYPVDLAEMFEAVRQVLRPI